MNFNTDRCIRRGDIYYADLSPIIGSEQGGRRPVLIVQNETGNHFSPTVIVASITSQAKKKQLPTHVTLPLNQECGLTRNSKVLLEQVRTLDKSRLGKYVGRVSEEKMKDVNTALSVSFGL